MQSTGSFARFAYTQYHMGVDARIVVYAKDRAFAEAAVAPAFERIAELDSIMSDYRQDSELMLLCAKAGQGAVRISPDLFRVLSFGQEVAQRSDGAFDVSIGPLIQLWRNARKSGALPTQAEIDAARSIVGYRNIRLDACRRTAALAVAGMKLDLGGIAKGYACDEAQRVLKRKGIRSALVEMGGDIVVSGPPPGKQGWTIRLPNASEEKGPIDREFANCAISTSGDTEQFVVIGGLQYSHVVDPRTGWALTNRIQATVVAPNGLTADPLSKLLALLGEEQGLKTIRHYPNTKVFVKSLKGPIR